MHELLNGILAPITYTVGFLDCDVATVATAYSDWQRPIQFSRNIKLNRRNLSGNLECVLRCLLPLTSIERRRFTFIPTASRWTAFFDNGYQSTDAVAPMSYLAQTIGCRALRATYIPENAIKGLYPARILEVFGSSPTDFLNYIRSIAVVYDGSKWNFSATGTIQPFEDIGRYRSRAIQSRFDGAMLESYLSAMEIQAFAEGYYRCDSSILIEKDGPSAPGTAEFQIA